MYKSAYYPIIYLGLGIEFQQPSIIAEALTQAPSYNESHIRILFWNVEAEAPNCISDSQAEAPDPAHPQGLWQRRNTYGATMDRFW